MPQAGHKVSKVGEAAAVLRSGRRFSMAVRKGGPMAAVVIAVLLALALAAVLALYVKELRRMARFLRELPPESNQRLAAPLPLPGLASLAAALDGRVEEERRRARQRAAAEEEFQQGLASLSHDIRTPLAGAKGYLQLAEAEPDEAVKRGYLESAVARLEQLFAYTRSTRPAPEGSVAEVDAAALLAEVLLGNLPVFEERGWEPAVDLGEEPLLVAADAAALRRVFENVVGNALAHGAGDFRVERCGPDGGEGSDPGANTAVGVAACDCTSAGRRLVFSNRLPAGARPDATRVFDRFYQGDASRSGGGAGLGLSVVQNLCAQMGATATATVTEERFELAIDFR